tara:strand:- start:540 stop:776 length:237 start_codon:yes stop_codon:yes gene_type:complete
MKYKYDIEEYMNTSTQFIIETERQLTKTDLVNLFTDCSYEENKIQKYTLPDKSKATVLFCGYDYGNSEYEMTGNFKEE